jgi:hypothetical protein
MSWKSFMMKFTRLARNQQWTEDEQHDHFCFSVEGAASEYYTFLLETSPDLSLNDILARFEKRFGSSAPDITHQLNFQSAVQFSGETLRQSGQTAYSLWQPENFRLWQMCIPRL